MIKRALQVVGGLLLLLFLVVGIGAYRTFGTVKPTVDGEQVGSGTAVVTGHVQAFILDAGPGAVILVDAGMKQDAADLLAALKKRGLGTDAVKAILVTHGHPDHIGGIAAFPGVEVYAHRLELGLMNGAVPSEAPARKVFPHSAVTANATTVLEDGMRFEVQGKQVEVFLVPGHTPGSVAYLIDGALYLGDSAVGGKDGAVQPAPWFFSNDTEQNRDALVKLADRLKGKDVRALVFSHSGAMTGGEGLQKLAESLRR